LRRLRAAGCSFIAVIPSRVESVVLRRTGIFDVRLRGSVCAPRNIRPPSVTSGQIGSYVLHSN